MAKLSTDGARPSQEQYREALAWATEVARHKKAELKKRIDHEELARGVVEVHDYFAKKGVDLFSHPIEENTAIPDVLRNVSAALMERDNNLPQPLKDFAVASLREPNRPNPPGPKKYALGHRDLIIGILADNVMKKWGFRRTRNRHNTKDPPCAVSIVKEALAAGADLHMGEAHIIKTLNRWERFTFSTKCCT